MINKEEFEFHRSIIDWMRDAGTPFLEAMAVVSYAHQADKSIPESYLDFVSPYTVRNEEKENNRAGNQ